MKRKKGRGDWGSVKAKKVSDAASTSALREQMPSTKELLV